MLYFVSDFHRALSIVGKKRYDTNRKRSDSPKEQRKEEQPRNAPRAHYWISVSKPSLLSHVLWRISLSALPLDQCISRAESLARRHVCHRHAGTETRYFSELRHLRSTEAEASATPTLAAEASDQDQ